MKEFFITLFGILFTGIVILLCLCCCYLSAKSDEYWEKLKLQMEKKKNDRS